MFKLHPYSAFLFLTLLLGNALPGHSQCGSSSNTYTFTYGGNTYDIVKTTNIWSDAAACAVQKGGHLLHINSQAEQDTVYQRILNGAGVNPNYTSVSDGGGVAYVWIGANDMASEGTWVWDGDGDSTGTVFWMGEGTAGSGGGSPVNGEFNQWGGSSSGSPKEPDNYNGSQHAAGMALGSWPNGLASEWNDINASNPLYFVVEYENTTSLDPEEKDMDEHLEVRPNPVQNQLHWSSSMKDVDAYQVLDPSGRTLLQGSYDGSGERRIELSDIEGGIYFLELRNEEGRTIVQRFVKAR